MHHLLFAGSFDPPTWGHLDIIDRAARLCERLTVGVAINSNKVNSLLLHADRLELLQELCHDIPRVTVAPIAGLVATYAKENQVDQLIRSLRSGFDLEKELAMALANRQMAGFETLFLTADPRYASISSTLVREIAHFGGSLESFVPQIVEKKIFARKTGS